MLRSLPIVCSACIAAAAVLTACRGEVAAASEPEQAIAVQLARVAFGPLHCTLRVPGVLGVQRQSALAFGVPGRVLRVLVKEGDRVRRGQLLAELDASELAASHMRALEQLNKTERESARMELLANQGAVAVATQEDARTALQLARATVLAASVAYGNTRLVAPEDGRIAERTLDVGEVVGPGRHVLLLAGYGHGPVARVYVGEHGLSALHLGDAVRVSLDVDGRVFRGAISHIEASASATTGTFLVEVTLPDPEARTLRFGIALTVEFESVEPACTTVPVASLVDAVDSSAFVYVVREGRAWRVPVRLRAISAGRACIEVDLHGVDAVVEVGAPLLRDGTRVDVRE